MGFLFVDRITALDDESASGELEVPPGWGLPAWLVIEAVGQLAGWIAIARSEFRSRPVAALVGDVRVGVLEPSACAATRVALRARIERFDGRAILYSGMAACGDATLAVVLRCVGPLLPVDVFDDPEALRARLAALRAGGVRAVSAAVPAPELSDITRGERGVSAVLHVPQTAEFFRDHFPRRAVFPASLLADAQNRIARLIASEALGVDVGRVRPAAVRDFKIRAFSEPGQTLELHAELVEAQEAVASVKMSASTEGSRTATGRLDYRIAP
ncbi:MAG: hypothetical protein AB7V27_03450 [Candidatus Binatia bacterium]